MMTAVSPEQTILRAIRDSAAEHAQLLAKVRALESLIEVSTYPAPGDVARKLRELSEELVAHMDDEEKGLLYAWIPEHLSALREEAEQRRREHGPIVVALRQLADEAEGAADAGLASELGVRIRATIASLRQHEAAESAILQRALHEVR